VPDKMELSQLVISAMTGAGGALGAWVWFRYWVKQTDRKLEFLATGMAQISTDVALIKQAGDFRDGRFKQLQESITHIGKETNSANAKADKLWTTLEAHPSIVPSRLSDQDGQ